MNTAVLNFEINRLLREQDELLERVRERARVAERFQELIPAGRRPVEGEGAGVPQAENTNYTHDWSEVKRRLPEVLSDPAAREEFYRAVDHGQVRGYPGLTPPRPLVRQEGDRIPEALWRDPKWRQENLDAIKRAALEGRLEGWPPRR
jgi:hypothetical protein